MKKSKPVREKRKLILKPEIIKILTTHELKRPRGGGDGESCSGNGNSVSNDMQ